MKEERCFITSDRALVAALLLSGVKHNSVRVEGSSIKFIYEDFSRPDLIDAYFCDTLVLPARKYAQVIADVYAFVRFCLRTGSSGPFHAANTQSNQPAQQKGGVR